MKEFEKASYTFTKRYCKSLVLSSLLLFYSTNEAFATQKEIENPVTRVTVNISNTSLVDAFKKLESYGVLVFYSSNIDNPNKQVQVKADNKTLKEIFDSLLAGTQNTYSIEGRQVFIKRVNAANPRQNNSSEKKQLEASGRVVSEDGKPIAGASVTLVGGTASVSTDDLGHFRIAVPNGNAKLIVSYVGYERQQVTAGLDIRVTLMKKEDVIEEVVVTGVTKTDKRLFTGASTKLNAEDMKIDGMPEISRSLEGRVAGVSVQNVSGTFGTAPKIRVRGATSIYGSSKPLWVVDGVIMEDVTEVSADDLSSGDAVTLISSAVAGLNADDIESFQILKDGSATSIYGARAMAGVIVVTTKKGKAGVSRLSYTGEYTTRQIPSYGDFNIMNSQEQMGIYKEMESKGWLNFGETYRAQNSGIYGHMYKLLNTYDPTTGMFGLANTEEQKLAYLRAAEMRNTDWFDVLFNDNIMQNHSLSLTNGTERSTYYASLSAMNDPGWTKQSKTNRYTANLNMSYKIIPNLSLNLIANASNRKQRAPGTLSQETDPVFGEVKRNFDINPYNYAMNTSRALEVNTFYTRNYAPFNILHELENNYIDIDVSGLKFQGELRWRAMPGLEFSALGAFKYENSSQQHNILDNANQALAYRSMDDATIRDNNSFLYLDPNNPYALPISVLPEGGIYRRTDYGMMGQDFRVSGAYTKTIANTHVLNLNVGGEYNSYDRERSFFNGWGMQYALGEIPFYVYEFFKQGIEQGTDYYGLNHTKSRKVGFYANPTYSYKHKYNLSATVRYDGSNRLGSANSARWLPTWNVGASWNAHDEAFFDNLKPVFSHLTMRSSYSLTGESGVDYVNNANMIIHSYNPWRPFSDMKESGLMVTEFPNNNLTYEKKHELNVGVDMGFLSNRINLVADWYTRDNFDLIGPIYTDGVAGKSLKWGNVAAMKSKGVEFTLTTKNIMNEQFNWNTSFTMAWNQTNITKLDATSSVVDLVKGTGYVKEGYPVRSIFSIPFVGLDREGLPIFINEDGEETTFDIDFQQNAIEKLKFLKYEGSADPHTMGSLGNIFTYKNFRLNVFMTYSFGNVIRLDQVFKSKYDDMRAMPREFSNRWTLPGDEGVTSIPAIINRWYADDNPDMKIAYNAYNFSSFRVADGGFIRMKEISLGYDFPKDWIGSKMNNLSVKLQATNPFLIYADKKLNGQDPEFFRSGGVAAPVPKQYTLTVRVGI
ncbi:SusC/RagA family TonB-linked outer membrane protein [Sphingobacterium kyonggiense]|uniref:SusC/RagA family TonB-linked outer membrane protein n=1 Tax=Sphingobacterium kyonggiense TaxID=714075 RepID=A0ABP7YAY7_9SPHI